MNIELHLQVDRWSDYLERLVSTYLKSESSHDPAHYFSSTLIAYPLKHPWCIYLSVDLAESGCLV